MINIVIASLVWAILVLIAVYILDPNVFAEDFSIVRYGLFVFIILIADNVFTGLVK